MRRGRGVDPARWMPRRGGATPGGCRSRPACAKFEKSFASSTVAVAAVDSAPGLEALPVASASHALVTGLAPRDARVAARLTGRADLAARTIAVVAIVLVALLSLYATSLSGLALLDADEIGETGGLFLLGSPEQQSPALGHPVLHVRVAEVAQTRECIAGFRRDRAR